MCFGSIPAPAVGGGSFQGSPRPAGSRCRRAFTLVELLVVIGILLIMMVLIAPAFTQMNAARAINKANYDISSLLEEARAYAKANNTYTWVGFTEEDISQAGAVPAVLGTGRVVISVIASKNGTAMYDATATSAPPLTTTGSPAVYNLTQISNLVKIDNVHLAVLNPTTGNAATDEVPLRGKVPDSTSTSNPPALINVPVSYQVGDQNVSTPPTSAAFVQRPPAGASNTTFNYPLYASAANTVYTFYKVIQFNPLGDAVRVVDSPYQLIEIGLRPTHGTTVDANTKNLSAIQISGIGGAVRIYRQ